MATNEHFRHVPVQLSVVCSDPAEPVSNNPVRFGILTGVALIDEVESTELTSIDVGHTAWDLSVAAVDANGNSAVAVGDAIFYVDADTPKLSKKTTGYFFGIALQAITSGATATITVLHVPSPGAGTLGAGSVGATQLATASVTAVKLSSTIKTGYIPLDITTPRILSTNAVQNTTEAGVPDGNTAPTLARVNGATDIALALTWAANAVNEIQFAPVALPPDVDDTANLTLNFLISKDTNTDTAAVVGVKCFEGIGGSNFGGNTAALATAAVTKYTVTVTAANLTAYPNTLHIAMVPGTHANDAVILSGAWIEYTRA